MTTIEKALLNKELSKASTALHQAFRIASTCNPDLAKTIRRQQKLLADSIIKLNGGPVKLTGADLLNG